MRKITIDEYNKKKLEEERQKKIEKCEDDIKNLDIKTFNRRKSIQMALRLKKEEQLRNKSKYNKRQIYDILVKEENRKRKEEEELLKKWTDIKENYALEEEQKKIEDLKKKLEIADEYLNDV